MVTLATASTVISLLVAAGAIVIAGVAYKALRRRQNPMLLVIMGAFLVLAMKNLFSALMVQTHYVPHDAIELTLSLFDLVIITLFALPLLLRTG